MTSELLSSSIAGALFGAALASSGVYLPSVITSQMQLASFHMLKVFLTASASSCFILASFQKFGLSNNKPRSPSSLGLFGRYDGNILGGAMIGLGMTLTGACPGTVLVQLTTGIRSGWYVMAGGVLGGIVYTRLFSRLRRNEASVSPDAEPTVHGRFGIKSHHAVFTYELLCATLISLAMALGPREASVSLHPLLGGALIGVAQAASLVLTGAPVGVSTAYEVLGSYIWQAWGSLSGQKLGNPPASTKSVYFAVGIAVGSAVFALSMPSMVVETSANISPVRGVLGGLIMVLGARLAGGCTSGHGISGMSMLSVSSFITVACMFAGGLSAALLL